jgi:hypothetical protein
VRLPGQAYRHGAADAFQVNERRRALERTRRRAQQLDFEAPGQSLKLLQPAVSSVRQASRQFTSPSSGCSATNAVI